VEGAAAILFSFELEPGITGPDGSTLRGNGRNSARASWGIAEAAAGRTKRGRSADRRGLSFVSEERGCAVGAESAAEEIRETAGRLTSNFVAATSGVGISCIPPVRVGSFDERSVAVVPEERGCAVGAESSVEETRETGLPLVSDLAAATEGVGVS
jgi:hypothetical protein